MKSSTRALRQNGFTLVELIIVLAIAGMVMAFAVPAYRDFVARSMTQTTAGQFMRAAQTARTEAIRLGGSVTICGQSSAASCAANTGSWSDGWRVYTTTASGTSLLLSFTPEQTMIASASTASMTFAQSGRVNGGSDFTITFSTPDNRASSTITVESYGRAHD